MMVGTPAMTMERGKAPLNTVPGCYSGPPGTPGHDSAPDVLDAEVGKGVGGDARNYPVFADRFLPEYGRRVWPEFRCYRLR